MSYPIGKHLNATSLLFRQQEQSALNTRLFITETLNVKHALAQLSPEETYTLRSARIKATVVELTQLNHTTHIYAHCIIHCCVLCSVKFYSVAELYRLYL